MKVHVNVQIEQMCKYRGVCCVQILMGGCAAQRLIEECHNIVVSSFFCSVGLLAAI